MKDLTPAPTGPMWMRDEAAIAWRFVVLTAAALLAIRLAVEVRVITVAAFLAFAQASLLWPLVRWLTRFMPCVLASLLVLAVYTAGIGAVLWMIVVQLVSSWPIVVEAVLGSATAANDWFADKGWALPHSVIMDLQEQARSRIGMLFSGIGEAALTGLGLLGAAATLLLVATFATLFALIGGEDLVRGFTHLAPRGHRDDLRRALRSASVTARWWMLASTVTGAVDGLFIGLGMHLLGLPLSAPIGLATFVLGFIPMIGATVAGIVAVAVGLFFGGLPLAAATLVLVLAVQQIEGNVLSPLLLSRAMQFPPLLTLLTSALGGAALGVVGLFLAVPVAGILTAAVKGWRRGQDAEPAREDPRPGPDGIAAAPDPGPSGREPDQPDQPDLVSAATDQDAGEADGGSTR